MTKMRRRTFLKASAATAVLSAVPLYFNFNDYQKVASEAPINKIPTTCNGCASMCGLFAHIKNDRLWKIEGHPIHLKSRGRLCARGHGMASDLYGKGRVTGPMKRTGEESFEPISWEQAFKEIGEKTKEIVNTHGGNSVMWLEHGVRGKYYADQFLDVIGSSNYVTHYSTCFTSKTNAWQNMVGSSLNGDHENSKYMIFEGRNFAGGIIPHGMNQITKAKEKGAKIIVIDPRYSEIAKIADEWIPIRAGTDLAFRLGLAHVLITENLYDKVFVNKYVEGFDEFWNVNKKYTPEWAAEVSGISADKIREIARELAKNAPESFIEPGWHGLHSHYINSTQTAQMGIVLNALLGNFYKRGGLMPSASIALGSMELPAQFHPEKGPRIDGAGVEGEFLTVETGRGIAQRLPDAIEAGKLKALFVYHFNPLRNAPDPEYQKKIKNAELVVSIPVDWNETSIYAADYILPESYYLERTEAPMNVSGHISHDHPQISLRQQVVKPLYDTKPLLDIMRGISNEMGYSLYDYTVEDQIKAAVEPLGITPERLKQAGTIEFPATVKPGFPESNGKPSCGTFTGKIEFSIDLFRLDGKMGIPTWIPPMVMPNPDIKEEFRLIHGKCPWHSHGVTSNNPELMAITEQYNGTAMWLNTKRANDLGIKNGDTVIVESDIAKKTVKVRVTEFIHPEAVWIPAAYGGFSKKFTTSYNVGVNYNDFIPAMVEPHSGSTMSQEVIVTVRKVAN
ncbi:respiratory selenite reductase catalytic subunit SrrA [Bacillaceae bacterium IKA-2]|nr:respiratory selenite reductase catalytic subunit SrrA [Bacillaceae bacterium IKA-2]